MVAAIITEYASRPNHMHSPLFYQVAGGAFPIFLVAFARSGRLRFPATTTAAVYAAIILAMMWILQLFPAQPKLAPIYNAVTHMVPPHFPLLLVVPALAIDFLLARGGRRHDWLMSIAVGVAVRRLAARGAVVLRRVSAQPRCAQLLLRRRSVALHGRCGRLAVPVLAGAEGRGSAIRSARRWHADSAWRR